MKKSVKALLYTAGAATAVTAGVAEVLYHFALTGKGLRQIKPLKDKMAKNFDVPVSDEKRDSKAAFYAAARAWYASVTKESVSTTNCIGDDCYAKLVRQNGDSHLWALIIHGYSSNPSSMSRYAKAYYEKGFNIILPHMRGHESSGTDTITMGWYDRYDMIGWIYYILDIDPEAQIVLHGESMGAATVMMTVGEPLPENVKCAIEDCGFSGVWDVFAAQIGYTLKLPTFPFLYAADVVNRIRAGFGFKEASSLRQLRNSVTPMLFIHGEADTFVPFDMVYDNYNAFEGEKDILTVPGAGHAESIETDPETYLAKLWDFVGRYVDLKQDKEEKDA